MSFDLFGQKKEWKTHLCSDINSNLEQHQSVIVAGWVHFLRDKGKLIFVHLRDSTGICQILFKKDVNEETFAQAKRLTFESVVTIEGKIHKDERVRSGAEITPLKMIIHSIASPGLPLDINQKTPYDIDTEFRFRELSIRTPRIRMIMEIKAEMAYAIRTFFRTRGFTEIYTPYILATSTEGGAEKFNLDYFGTPAVLAQSNQFYKQAAITVHEKVFGILPSWRAEKSRTTKHLVEFHQIENEIAFGTDETIMEIQEQLVHNVFKHIKTTCVDALNGLKIKNLQVPKIPFKRFSFYEAKDLLETKLDITEFRDDDFTTPAETALSHYIQEPFFITKFPTHLRGIYYETDPQNELLTKSMDLIAPSGFGELSSGGQRVTSKERLLNRIINSGHNPDSFSWYLRMFQYGMPPHAGYGLGFERLVRWVCGLNHIRDGILFPRTPDLVTP